jgi:hypothetical protein
MIFIRKHSLLFAQALLLLSLLVISHSAQSSLQDHPTPITRNEISGTIKARDVGDSRLTTHYYWFEGAQGDVFINLSSKNFAGDVDIFAQNGLRSLSKIVVYADFGEVETGRVVYLRKPERLLLRIQGRTPNDESATYRLKFAGSFVAAVANEKDIPELPVVNESETGAVRVNSVGTILPPLPKVVETKSETEVEKSADTSKETADLPKVSTDEKKEAVTDPYGKKNDTKPEVVVTDELKKDEVSKSAPAAKTLPRRKRATPPKKVVDPAEEANGPVEKTDDKRAETAAPETKAKAKAEPPVDPLANVQLVILFKNGSKIERPLPEVSRFSVDRGVLTVVSKSGHIGKYQMVDVTKVTIE